MSRIFNLLCVSCDDHTNGTVDKAVWFHVEFNRLISAPNHCTRKNMRLKWFGYATNTFLTVIHLLIKKLLFMYFILEVWINHNIHLLNVIKRLHFHTWIRNWKITLSYLNNSTYILPSFDAFWCFKILKNYL